MLLFLSLFIFSSSSCHSHMFLMDSQSYFSMTSFKSANLPSDRGAIEYKRPTVVLLLAILTLYPTSSPLFHVLCLPVLTLLHRHDTRLFILYTSICIGSVSYTADLRGGREIVSAGIHCVLGVGIVVESILAHQALVAMLWRSAWSDSLLFSLIWSGCGIISRAIHFVSLSWCFACELMHRMLSPPQAPDTNASDSSPVI